MKVGIIDYEAGNLASLSNTIIALGHEPVILSSPKDFHDLIHLILPGVGSFGYGMKKLRDTGWDIFIKDYIANKSGYFLGICLGMQLMCESSEEEGLNQGLGLIPGKITKMIPVQSEEKIPHVGWNDVKLESGCPLTVGIPTNSDFYFVHSYGLQDIKKSEFVIGTTDFSQGFTSIVKHSDLAYGVQFHPEKSSKHGLRLLKNFLDLC